jgi:hypothetical protein
MPSMKNNRCFCQRRIGCVLTETTSNLHHDTFINNIDTIITPFTNEDFENFCPEILVTLEWSFRNESKLFKKKIQTKNTIGILILGERMIRLAL